jgi:L-seryl-tRNA(Ser) seleniumtransferase
VNALRSIPAVEKVLQALGGVGLPRPVVVAAVRRELAALRKGGRRPGATRLPSFDDVLGQIRSVLDTLSRSRLQPVINGTGILVHTNLGRAPLGPVVVEALQRVAASYTNLELDLTTGERGGRASYLEHALAVLCGSEAATVVNNCAAALVLILRHFTAGERKEVVISRGELVQIGGGFRIPEILEASGARLREVGTTNQTTLADYARAIHPATALILKVHRSNFFMGGFVTSPSTEELGALASKQRVPLVEDLGSGAVVPTEKLGNLEHEPMPAEVLKRGVNLVCFSGDKLLGGPQAGIIAGKARLVTALKRNPFFRALRCDKLILAALQATVDAHLSAAAPSSASSSSAVPVLSMLQAPDATLRARAERIVAALAGMPAQVNVGEGSAQLGGGTLPRSVVPSVTLDLLPQEGTLAGFAARLRVGNPPVIGYLGGGRFKLDLRTVFPDQDAEVVRALQTALVPGKP